MARPSIYNDSIFPEVIIEKMSQGMLDYEIYAALGISKDTFVRWRKEHPGFNEAYEIGYAKCQSWWLTEGKKRFAERDDAGYKYWISIMNNKFGWGKGEGNQSAITNNTQININQTNILQEKSKEELIEYLKDQCADANLIPFLPASLVDVTSDKDKSE